MREELLQRLVSCDSSVRKPYGQTAFVLVGVFLSRWRNQGLLSAFWLLITLALEIPVAWAYAVSSYLTWKMSPPVTEETFLVRRDICASCLSLKVADAGWFCGACPCGERQEARLDVRNGKNGRRDHNCPEGLHPGSVALPAELRVGCNSPGCGGGTGGVAQPPPLQDAKEGTGNVRETVSVGNNGSVGVYGAGATATAFGGVAAVGDVGKRGT